MPCYHPLTGYRSKEVNASGKRSIVFNRDKGQWYRPLQVPCQKCIGCKLEYSRQWAIRCMHEAQLHDENCFLTLTYDDEHLPYGGTLIKKHHQDFMKRLRRYVRRKISFYHCGEYGERYRRPHYHTLIFGYDFPDKEFFTQKGDNPLYTSEILARIWPMGHSTVGALTFDSAAYCARYATKKLSFYGERAYEYVDLDTGEISPMLSEYTTMSLKPAIASRWYDEFKQDVFPSDQVIVKGKEVKPPKFYSRRFEHDQPVLFAKLKERRERAQRAQKHNNTPERLKVRETVKKAAMQIYLKREIE